LLLEVVSLWWAILGGTGVVSLYCMIGFNVAATDESNEFEFCCQLTLLTIDQIAAVLQQAEFASRTSRLISTPLSYSLGHLSLRA
jgi:hypothetical protein